MLLFNLLFYIFNTNNYFLFQSEQQQQVDFQI